jgi:tetratricopeptide (TPR) repeat protein
MPTVKVVATPSKGDGMPESVQETVRTHLDHGGACLDKGKHDEAIADYDKAIALDPNFALAYSNRGLAYAKKGDVDRAIADYTKAIALDPNFADAYTNRGVACYMRGDKEQAIADFRKALEIDPSDHLTKNNLKALGVTP